MKKTNVLASVAIVSLVLLLTVSCNRAQSVSTTHKASFYIRDTTGKVVSIQNITVAGSKVEMPDFEASYGSGYRWYDAGKEKVWVGNDSLYKPGDEVRLKEDTRFTCSELLMKLFTIDYYVDGSYDRIQYDAYQIDGMTPAVITLKELEDGYVWENAETGNRLAGGSTLTVNPSESYLALTKVEASL